MKPELKIKALAELANWKPHLTDIGIWIDEYGNRRNEQMRPKWESSYDAIIPLIQKQDSSVQSLVYRRLSELFLWEYTPAQLAEALLRATGKWIE